MKQVLIRQGRVVVEEMPAPTCGPGEVLVRASRSLISTGTETASLAASTPTDTASRWMRRLQKTGEVVRMVSRRGLSETRAAVEARLEGPSQVSGYSLAGTVVQVGGDVDDLTPGQHVACAGAASAHHAELVAVPRQLVVAVPEGLPPEQAAFVTLGAIALHGVRQAEVRLGEFACVMGLGLIGQLSVALLRVSGCRVAGVDLDRDRLDRAHGSGLELGLHPPTDDVEPALDRFTAGRGVDVVILAAATTSSELIRQAVRILRPRGRVVVVGDVGMEIDRAAFYMKEAELRVSRSYGPGRYDPHYEEQGRDYPYDYVRWTENRNMQEFLRLAASGAVPLDALVDRTFPVEAAADAYRAASGAEGTRPLGVLLRYAEETPLEDVAGRRTTVVVPRESAESGVAFALVGPGSFANEVHLPNLARLAPAASTRAVVGRTANAAREAARQHAAGYATTDLDEVLADDRIDAVLICTRHDQHADQAARAIRAGKAVFAEKPAAIDAAGLSLLESALDESGTTFTVGFNRRFAPDIVALKALLERRGGPLVVDYRVNAGRLPREHWALGHQGGGRLIGEACHMIDLLTHLVGRPRVGHAFRPLAPPPGRDDLPFGDNFVLTCAYSDGSIATLAYTSLGHPAAGKERIELHWDGVSAVVKDFAGLTVHGRDDADRAAHAVDKGHAELLRRFVEHVSGRAAEPIPRSEIMDVSRFVLDLDRQARGRDD
jgi:predicted dehydrogenase